MKILVVLMVFFVSSVNIDKQNNFIKQFNINKDNVAISGYDAVSYFKKIPKLGKKSIYVNYKGVIFQFYDDKNKELFLKNPLNYIPQYGGWCAYAMGKTGEKVSINPTTYKIVNNKLYLFYNKFFTNTLKSWNKNEKYLIIKADLNWIKIISRNN